MKATSLLLLRLSTGIYLIVWGLIKFKIDVAANVSDKYYAGLISGETVSFVLGGIQVLLGLFVCLGLFRAPVYLAQLAWYFAGAVPIIAYLIDPLGLYLAEMPKPTFFPSWTLLFASLIMIAFKEDDQYSLDHKRGK